MFGIRARVVSGPSEKTIEKFFKSEAARDKWIEKQDEAGKLIEITSWSFPDTPGFGWRA